MKNESEEIYGVRGGQGRTAREMHDSALAWAVMILAAVVAMFVLMGCQHLNRIGPF